MVYPDEFESKIGFDKIRDIIKEYCLSETGSRKVDEIEFLSSFETIQKKVNETAELREICVHEDSFPVNYYYNAIPYLKRVRIEGTFLETDELLYLRRSQETINSIVRFFKDLPDKNKYPALRNLIKEIKLYPFITKKIDTILTKEGKIRDNASPGLSGIRKDIKHKQTAAGKKLQLILKSAIDQGFVESDTNLSMRNGRHVIPVPSTYKRMIKGFIHDESASGKTSFIEPSEIVELNNEIKELEYEERREIIRILTRFTDSIRPYLDDLLISYDILGTIDFTRAKALFAIKIDAVKPSFFNTQSFRWINARHPLLFISHKKEGKEIVPLNIYLNEKNRILLISGPNAGGKSVCLMTVGLLQYMLQCGLLVPMGENSEAGIYKDIFIDIGDEQSLENDLSTYSSHLLNMKYFIKKAGTKSLVLIDEFGSGTEPMLGGAIAEAILDTLNQIKSYGVLTTHYTNLKHFASSAEGIINGAMLFDTNKMQPLFRLEIGKPGSSFAIDIARQIGLSEKILKNASERIGQDHIRFDKHLREILRDKKYWEERRGRIKAAEKKLQAIIEQYTRELDETKKFRKEIIDKAKKDAEEILAGANKEIEKAIRIIKESQAEKEKTRKARKEFEEYRSSLKRKTEQEDTKIEGKLGKLKQQEKYLQKEVSGKESHSRGAVKDELSDTEIKIGDRVRLYDQDTVGEVIDISKDNIAVAFGSMIITVKSMKLKKLSGDELKKTRKTVVITGLSSFDTAERKLHFKPEVDVRGKRAEEALDIVGRFIDDAVIVATRELRILHGKGDGILKNVIRDYLKSLDIVKSCKDEHVERGGAGITVVILDM
ncbi:MAG: Smr/MutS family protein [Bacteroidales bacterium]|nr:MAG: Smr/MutS family protein [Bacteroidales bacterium]